MSDDAALVEKLRDLLEAEYEAREQAVNSLAEARKVLKECADELAAWVEGHYQLMLNYPSEKRRFERDMEPVRRARAFLSLPTTELAKAERT
jgi:hypothetical protein